MIEEKRILELIRLFRSGDNAAFDKIYSLMYNRQYYLAFKLLRDEYAAQDVVQDSFLSLYKNLNTLKEEKAFFVYLNRTTYNYCIDYLRAEKKEGKDFGDPDDYLEVMPDYKAVNPEDKVTRDEHNHIIMEAVNQLPLPMRSVVILKYFNGLKEKEIAEVLQCPVGTVKSRLSTAKKNLSIALKGIYSILPFVFVGKAMQAEAAAAGYATAASSTYAVGVSCAVAAFVSVAVVSGNPVFRNVCLVDSRPYVSSQVVEAEVSSPIGLRGVWIEESGQQGTLMTDKYIFDIQSDGEYLLKAEDIAGNISEYRIHIDNIDKNAPVIIDQKQTDSALILTAEDDKSGLDWEKCGVLCEGSDLDDAYVNTDESQISIPLDAGDKMVYLTDHAGNKSEYKILMRWEEIKP